MARPWTGGPFGVGEWVEWRKIAMGSFHFETSLDIFFLDPI